jgi:tetratricopeptide (TPR) repeat protein
VSDQTVETLRNTFEDLRQRIEGGKMRDDAGLKRALMEVYKDADTSMAQFAQLKEEIKQLVERWKAGHSSAQVMVPHFGGVAPVMHEDHLGASTFLEKGWSKISLGDYEGAETVLQHALTLAPTSTEGESLLGWAQMLQDKLDAALMHFHQVLSREPSNALARINVGYICLKKGIFGEAIEHLSKALRQGEDARAKLYANFYLGLVYIEREMYEDAQIFFERSIALGPNLVEAYFELGHAFWLSGKQDSARDIWEQGATVNRFNHWSKRCEELLAIVDSGGIPTRAWLSRGG